MTKRSLYEEIGKEKIEAVLRLFYERAIVDPMICQFFMKIDLQALIAKQLEFTSSLLGATDSKYTGRPLRKAHENLKIRKPHLKRREVMMAEAMADCEVPIELARKWSLLEASLNGQISKDAEACNH